MGYSRKLSTLNAMVDILEPATHGDICEWTHEQPTALAYKIREAFWLTRLYPDAYPAITQLARTARVQVFSKSNLVVLFPDGANTKRKHGSRILEAIGESRVRQAAPRIASEETQGELPADLPLAPPAREQRQLVYAEKVGRFDIVARWEKSQESPASIGRKISFTDAQLTDADLDKLSRWAATHAWLVIADSEQSTVTLAQDNPVLRSVAWAIPVAT